MEQADAVIIGAGVVGCAVALELSRRGLNTLSIDGAATGAVYPAAEPVPAVVGTAMLFRAFPPERRARAAGILIVPTSLAPALGPLLGGLLGKLFGR